MAVISVNLTDTFEQWRTKTNSLATQQGDLTTLTTTAQNTMVAAINEIDAASTEVLTDTTPQLGGNLDVLARIITTSTTNGNIAITPHGSGKVVLDGISHPNADGTNGQVLQTNGSGVLSFATISSDPTMGGDLSGTASNAQIVANAVTATELAGDAVTGAQLADDACDSEHYTDGSIDNVHLATGIASSKLTGALPAIDGSALTGIAAFPSGTKMFFYQAAAPTGWTQDTTASLANRSLRVVVGSGGGTGGTHDLNSPPSLAHTHTGPSHTHTGPSHTHTGPSHNHGHSLSAGAHTLSTSQMPSHTHSYTRDNSGSSQVQGQQGANPNGSNAQTTGATGGSGSHSHSLSGSISAGGTGATGASGTGATGASGTGATGSTTPTAFAPKYVDVIIATKD